MRFAAIPTGCPRRSRSPGKATAEPARSMFLLAAPRATIAPPLREALRRCGTIGEQRKRRGRPPSTTITIRAHRRRRVIGGSVCEQSIEAFQGRFNRRHRFARRGTRVALGQPRYVCTSRKPHGLAGLFLTGAAYEAHRNAAFDTLTVHRINVLDREGKLAIVITNHDNFPLPVVNGEPEPRSSGNEQGALIWDGRVMKDGSFSSATTLSYDSVNTDQLLQLDDANENGKLEAFLIGWNRPDDSTPSFRRLLNRPKASTVPGAAPLFRGL